MAGGTNKRGHGWGTMAERVARSRGEDQAAEPDAPDLKHCWVTNVHGRHAGLLIRWRQATPDAAWEGLVAHAILGDDGNWYLGEEWLPAGMLDPL